MKIFVRFSETERYDPLKDAEVIVFMATTERGSYHAEVKTEGAKSLRLNRQAFMDRVTELIQAKTPPWEVALG